MAAPKKKTGVASSADEARRQAMQREQRMKNLSPQDKAFLKLNVQSCEACFSPEKLQKLERARIYIYGCKTNAASCNMKEADKLYKGADKILESILTCDC